MKNLLLTLTVLLSTSLSAFDISLDGVEFGTIEWKDINIPRYTTSISNHYISLNEGDVFQALDIGQNSGYYCTLRLEDINDSLNFVTVTEGDIIIGPGLIKISARDSDNTSNGYIRASYAILRPNIATQSSYATVPANQSGSFEVKLQTSTDLESWSPTTPGVFSYGNNERFFRLVVE